MIQSFYPNEEDNFCDTCRTTGCSCCSSELHIKRDKDKIIKEARDNIRVAKQICEYYKISFQKFCKDILTEYKCKKHQPYKKYDFKEKEYWYCWKCDKSLKEVDKLKELKEMGEGK